RPRREPTHRPRERFRRSICRATFDVSSDLREVPSMAEQDENEPAAREADRSWREEVLDIWLRTGAVAFPIIALVVIALRSPPRLDISAVVILVMAALIVVIARAKRWRFEVRATAALVVFASPPL